MTRILLDTSAYSAFMRGGDEALRAIQEADEICVNPIIIGELLAGFRKGTRRKENEAQLAKILSSPRVGVCTMDEDTAERYAIIFDALRQAGTPVPTHDIWIAATAMQHGLKVVTTDPHFARIPQVVAVVLV
jgi:predicted nucleic acid-binding protein